MLLIQQNLYRKDKIHAPPVHITTGNSVQTPTIEIKQKWSVINLMSNGIALNDSQRCIECLKYNKTRTENRTAEQKNKTTIKLEKICPFHSRNKIVGLRSLSDVTSDVATSLYSESFKLCTCMKHNTHTTCTHRCTGRKEQIVNTQTLTKSTEYVCSRTISHNPMQTNAPFYVSYQPYFMYSMTDASITVYYPLAVTEASNENLKYKKNNKPYEHYLYYDNSKEQQDEEMDGYHDIELQHNKYITLKDEFTNEQNPSEVDDLVINLEYDDNEKLQDLYVNQDLNKIDYVLEKGTIQVKNKDEFVDNVIDDLKKYYNDIVIKDCYCSSSMTVCMKNQKYMYWRIINICILLVFTL